MTCGIPSGRLTYVQLKIQENRGKGNKKYLRKWRLNFFKFDEIRKHKFEKLNKFEQKKQKIKKAHYN